MSYMIAFKSKFVLMILKSLQWDALRKKTKILFVIVYKNLNTYMFLDISYRYENQKNEVHSLYIHSTTAMSAQNIKTLNESFTIFLQDKYTLFPISEFDKIKLSSSFD